MGRTFLFLAALLGGPTASAADFKPPSAAERLKAIGSMEDLDPPLRRAFDPGDDFKPIPPPRPGDWLAAHVERGQTYDEFVLGRLARPRPTASRRKIYILPLGKFAEDRSPPLESLKELADAFFALETVVLPRQETEGLTLTTRKSPITGNVQILTGDVLAFLKKRLPRDAFCAIAVTMEDLYPEPSWNFVFGQASLSERCGVYSFARLDPAFYGSRRGEGDGKLFRRRSAAVLVHEVSHMFGLEHCIYFSCVLNGSNSLPESDSQPLTLCPVCLRKLRESIGFDVLDRYGKLLACYRKAGFEEETRWIEHRMSWISRSP